jgi:hypothetical protein
VFGELEHCLQLSSGHMQQKLPMLLGWHIFSVLSPSVDVCSGAKHAVGRWAGSLLASLYCCISDTVVAHRGASSVTLETVGALGAGLTGGCGLAHAANAAPNATAVASCLQRRRRLDFMNASPVSERGSLWGSTPRHTNEEIVDPALNRPAR